MDANFKFIFVDIGSYGKEGDSGIFNKSSISQMISTGEYFLSPEKLPDSNVSLPLVHIGDEAFRLDRHMMRPYSRIETKKDINIYNIYKLKKLSKDYI